MKINGAIKYITICILVLIWIVLLGGLIPSLLSAPNTMLNLIAVCTIIGMVFFSTISVKILKRTFTKKIKKER